MQTDNLNARIAGMNEDYIIDAIYLLRHENTEYHESIINILINEYDEYSVSCEGDGTDSAVSDDFMDSFFFFWSGLQGPKAYSLWGGVVPSPSIG